VGGYATAEVDLLSHRLDYPKARFVMLHFLAILLLSAAPECPIPATLDKPLHDADTIVATIHLPFSVDLPSRTIRAAGYDAWEVTRTRRTVDVTAAEIAKGKIARDDFTALIASGSLFVESTKQTDPYGRTNAYLWVRKDGEWIDVADWMKSRGHCRTP
jgi:endonuclease YncB( thermonuclease family)